MSDVSRTNEENVNIGETSPSLSSQMQMANLTRYRDVHCLLGMLPWFQYEKELQGHRWLLRDADSHCDCRGSPNLPLRSQDMDPVGCPPSLCTREELGIGGFIVLDWVCLWRYTHDDGRVEVSLVSVSQKGDCWHDVVPIAASEDMPIWSHSSKPSH